MKNLFKGFTVEYIINLILFAFIIGFGTYILYTFGVIECLLYFIAVILNNISATFSNINNNIKELLNKQNKNEKSDIS